MYECISTQMCSFKYMNLYSITRVPVCMQNVQYILIHAISPFFSAFGYFTSSCNRRNKEYFELELNLELEYVFRAQCITIF